MAEDVHDHKPSADEENLDGITIQHFQDELYNYLAKCLAAKSNPQTNRSSVQAAPSNQNDKEGRSVTETRRR